MSDQDLYDILGDHPEFDDLVDLEEADETVETGALPNPDLRETLQALEEDDKESRPSVTVIYGLSGLMRDDLSQLNTVWVALPAVYRRRVMRQLVESSETNIELDYRTIGLFSLEDSDPHVRESAIELLWEDNSLELMSRLVDLARNDAVVEVRAAAMTALGRFVLAGELGDLPEVETQPARDVAIHILGLEQEDNSVRRRALEAIANSSHDIVPKAIQAAYESSDQRMRVSAVFAMGRSCDEMWEYAVLEAIESDDPEMRYEAAKASGELELVEAVPHLGRLALEDDREIQTVSIWSLGEIGGKETMRILELLAEKADEDDDDDLLQAVEDAIGNASLVGDDIPDMWSLSLDELGLDEDDDEYGYDD